MRHIPPILLPLLALILPAASPAEPLAVHEWDARPADPRPYAGRIPHGSAARLVARLPGTPASATFHWQTNGMGRLWWETPAECASNAVSVLWTPAMDSGAPVHRAFFRIAQPEGPDYSAFATLAMLDSPGFVPNALPMPVQILDFAAVQPTNAPWAPLPAPTGAGVPDSHGCVHDAPVALGVGARAAPDGGGERAVSIAIGAGADATDPGHPEKSQAIALGNQSRAAGVNSIAIGSGVRHDDEDDMSGGNAYASAPQAVAIGYAAKAVEDRAWQLGFGTNSTPGSLKFGDVFIVRDGRIAVDGLDTNAVAAMIRALVTEAGYATLRTGVDTNGYAYALMASYDGAGADGDFRFFAATNPAVAAPLTIQTSGGIVRIYSEQTVDRLIAEAIAEYARTNGVGAGVATTNDIAAMHPDFEEWASPTVDRIAASAVAPSTTTAQRGDTYVTTGAASGYALRAVRSVRSSAGMDSETEIPGTWSIVGNTTAANLSSNVLSSTSTPGDVTVEFEPAALGAATMRAVVSMPGDAVRTATTWPAGEGGGWRSDKLTYEVDYTGSSYTTKETTWSGRTWVCTNWAAASDAALFPAWYARPAVNSAGGCVGAAPHYILAAAHCGYGARSAWPTGQQAGSARAVATWGDLRLYRAASAVPTNCVARFLRASVLATLSDSMLFRWLGVAHTQHGTVAPCLVEPRPSRADLSGLSWDSGWTYIGADTEWRNADLAELRQYSHTAHGGDSGHPVWFQIDTNNVPVGVFHWADGSSECLLSDALLDKIDSAIRRDSGNAESLQFYTAEALQ